MLYKTNEQRQLLDVHHYIQHQNQPLGDIELCTDIQSVKGPFRVAPKHQVFYPRTVIQALIELYREYNQAFTPLVAANREWETDYQFCYQDGVPVNCMVQIDMVGLPDSFLEVAARCDVTEVKEALRGWIFEIENSVAMYQLLRNLFHLLPFKSVHDQALDRLRNRTGKPVVLLAVTYEKLTALRTEEFGCAPNEELTDETVKRLSGFDALWGPDEFRNHVAAHDGDCQCLLYVRSSEPINKLKRPVDVSVDHPLLEDPKLRKIIKAHTVTMNIDNPSSTELEKKINDTKGYMEDLAMGYFITSEEELLTTGFLKHLQVGKQFADYPIEDRLTNDFRDYLIKCGTDPVSIASGSAALRFKPAVGTYGCYGHQRGPLTKGKVRQELRRELKKRGKYVVQPELPQPCLTDQITEETFSFIDRNFFAVTEDNVVEFMGGFRSFLPHSSQETQKGRNHGSEDTVWAPVYCV